nr:glycosyltransferase family A protein [Actinomycetota bacterium]
ATARPETRHGGTVAPRLLLADARELLADERILSTYAHLAAPDEQVALVAYGPGLDPTEYERSLRTLARRCDVDLDDGPRVLVVLPPGDDAGARSEVAEKVVAMLTARPAPGPFASLPVLRPGVPADWATLLSGDDAPRARSVSGPLVSVLVPVHNHARYLGPCLDSVLSQTYEDVEVLVVDDRSADDALRVAARYSRLDDRVRIVENALNLGLVGNHRRCLELASGEYVKFVHADDLLRPTAVERLVGAARSRPGVALATSARDAVDASGRVVGPVATTSRLAASDTVFAGAAVADLVLEHGINFVGEPSTVLFRRDAMDPAEFSSFHGREYTSLLDVSSWLALCERGDLAYVAAPQSELRLHDAQYGKVLGGVVEHLEWLELLAQAHATGRLAEPGRFARALEGIAARLVHASFAAGGERAPEVGAAVRDALRRSSEARVGAGATALAS